MADSTPQRAFQGAGRVIPGPPADLGFGVRAALTVESPARSLATETRRRARRAARRPRVEREAAELGAMVARMLTALARRAEGGDLEGLVELVNLQAWLSGCQKRAARALASEQGYSWAQLALRLGITKQAAHGRWGGE